MDVFAMSLTVLLLFTLYKSRKSIHMLQQNFYDESHRYFLWMTKNFKKVFLNVDIVGLFLFIFLFIKIEVSHIITIFTLLYIFIFIIYYKLQKKEQTKLPLVMTPRVNRLFVTEFIVYVVVVALMLCNFVEDLVPLYYVILVAMTYFNYFVILLCNYINKPIEKLVYLYYEKKAIKKLKDMHIPVIGITGSYGKTSSKNIINEILNVKYNSFATPKNFNTPYGLIRSINNYLDKFNDIFIAEMGAFKVGEIKTTCKLMHPTHGILTTIGEAHLESFGSRENIQKGKFELIESLPKDGIAILNADDEWQVNYKLKNKKCRVLWIGIKNQDVDLWATNIELTYKGTTFDVKFKNDDKLYKFHTCLLGEHNVYNLLGGILLGKELGMNIDELKRGVAMVKPIEHRLELKRNGTLNIIDDAYNSNPVGAKKALQVLRLMPGKKIIVTPGMIELGDKQYELNKKFGKMIAKVCDYVILVGKEQTKPIYDGLMAMNYDVNKIEVINEVVHAFDILKKFNAEETYVLLENDLPDLFNE